MLKGRAREYVEVERSNWKLTVLEVLTGGF